MLRSLKCLWQTGHALKVTGHRIEHSDGRKEGPIKFCDCGKVREVDSQYLYGEVTFNDNE